MRKKVWQTIHGGIKERKITTSRGLSSLNFINVFSVLWKGYNKNGIITGNGI